MSNKLEELRLKKSEIEKEIKNLEEKNIREKLQEHENNYLGHCFENDEIFFKIVCAASCNIYSVQIIGFYKEPKMINEQDFFDSNFHRHPFSGQTELNFCFEDDMFINNLKLYKEIPIDEFEKKLEKATEKLKIEMKKEFKLNVKEV